MIISAEVLRPGNSHLYTLHGYNPLPLLFRNAYRFRIWNYWVPLTTMMKRKKHRNNVHCSGSRSAVWRTLQRQLNVLELRPLSSSTTNIIHGKRAHAITMSTVTAYCTSAPCVVPMLTHTHGAFLIKDVLRDGGAGLNAYMPALAPTDERRLPCDSTTMPLDITAHPLRAN